MAVPHVRITVKNDAPPNPDGEYVLYWMISARRTRFHFGLDRAIEHARTFNLPILVLEALRADYPWASDRLHRFVIDGMRDNQARFQGSPIYYFPYVEPRPGAGSGLLASLAERAAVVVTDDYPCFFLPRMVQRAADRLPVQVEAVDSNGLLPMHSTPQAFLRAFDFRRYLQKHLAPHLADFPAADPLRGLDVPRAKPPASALKKRYPAADLEALSQPGGLETLPIDHAVPPAPLAGGERAGRKALSAFMRRMDGYPERNHPDTDTSSGLSPYLHFGHVAPHDVFARVARQQQWGTDLLASRAAGQREGWWNMSKGAEAFLDQIVTWRELGFNFCVHREDYDRYTSLPTWVRDNFADHVDDPRPQLYSLLQLERSQTHDEVWNAAQRQLVAEGRMHNYLRMLWGKNIVLWSRTPKLALERMLHLNNKYALDGRDPNSYSGIFWVLGRYDRPWAPKRPVLGSVRYMSSANTQKKLKLSAYLARWGPQKSLF